MKAVRLPENPIIVPDMDERMGSNINGPSLIRVPAWAEGALGRYYLYFAHHQGKYIRLAYADDLRGPWRIHTPGVLELSDSFFPSHIASPDVRIWDDRQEIWMYYHGCCLPGQWTRLAISSDGLRFEAREAVLGPPYWRTFEWEGWRYALGMPGRFYRSHDGLDDWEEGPQAFAEEVERVVGGKTTPCGMRHSAVRVRGDSMEVFYSNRGDCPERILMSTVRLAGDWKDWRPSASLEILQPEMDYEGVDAPRVPSRGGSIHEPAWQLRDPAIYEEDGEAYLLYSVAGERGIGMAKIEE